MDWSQCLAVERDPQKLSGAWIFRGTRLTVQTLFDNLDAGASVRDISEWYGVPEAQLHEVLRFVSQSLSKAS